MDDIEMYVLRQIRLWIGDLYAKIVELERKGREVTLVAISRKMPRIFEWLAQAPVFPSETGAKFHAQLAFILKHDLISEHAIPFFCKNGSDKSVLIVVDDIIITGKSMSEVIADITSLTKHPPFISAIFISDDCDVVFSEDTFINLKKVPRLDHDCRKKVVDVLCGFIKLSSLPMELEFPIFHFSDNYVDLATLLKNNANDLSYRSYEITHEGGVCGSVLTDFGIKMQRNVSVILEKELKWILNHDYPKIRLFENSNGASLEVSAPRVFSVSGSQSPDFFKQEGYAEIWNYILSSIVPEPDLNVSDPGLYYERKKVAERRALSLAVMANYLYSFSVAMNTWNDTGLLQSFPDLPEISSKDLTLLMASSVAREISAKLNSLAKEKCEEPRTSAQFLSTPLFLTPRGNMEKEIYMIKRYNSSHAFDTLFDALKDLFSIHTRCFGHDDYIEEYDWISDYPSDYGETIMSLEDLFNFHFNNDGNYIVNLNRDLDKCIDMGMVSPFYCKVKDDAGNYCWKRFYRGGSNSLL